MIRRQHFTSFVSNPGGQYPTYPVEGERMWYTTTLSTGTIAPTTGALYRPTGDWTLTPNRPLIIFAPGTRGVGPQCAGSKSAGRFLAAGSSLDPRQTQQSQYFSLITNYENGAVLKLLSEGYAVFVIDYVGGATGPMSYLNNIEAGHAVLDAARAVRGIRGGVVPVNADAPVGIWGYSQGGSAAVLGATLHSRYAPDVNLKVVYAGAPPLDLTTIIRRADGTMITGAGAYGVVAFMDRYPDLDREVTKVFNAHGMDIVHKVANECFLDTVVTAGWEETKTWTKDGRPLWKHFATNPLMRKRADEQLFASYHTPTVPILFVTNPYDDVVAYEQAIPVYKRWCSAGANAMLLTVKFGPVLPGTGMGHIVPIYATQPYALQFLADHFQGRTFHGCQEKLVKVD